MARLARIIVPGAAHHVTQRGNRRQPIFFCDDDRLLYLELVRAGCAAAQVDTPIYSGFRSVTGLSLIDAGCDVR